MTQSNPVALKQTRETILATACGGMAIALSTILSMFTIYRMPQGGTITPASMLPIIFCALAFGPAWGIGIGLVHGMLQFIVAPFAAHWASVFLDYPLAFGLLGLAGFFAAKKQIRTSERNILMRMGMISIPRFIIAIWIGMAGRTVSHLLSGVIFYYSYAEEAGMNPWVYSILYNGTYMLPEAIITTILLLPLVIIFRSLRKRNGL
jgi:thiamine transporter